MVNYGSAGTGALAGAASGATLGSIFPGIGTAIGGIGGGLLGALGGLFGNKSGGKPDKVGQIPRLLPEQQEYLKNTLAQLQGMQGPGGNYGLSQNYLQSLLQQSPEAYARFASPYQTQFQEQILPQIAERYAGLGGPLAGAGSNSGFAQALGGAATQYQSNLAGLYAQLQQQAAQQAMGQYNTLAGMGLGTQAFFPTYQPGNLGFMGTALGGIAQGVGSGIGTGVGTSLGERISDFLSKKKGVPSSPGTPTGIPTT